MNVSLYGCVVCVGQGGHRVGDINPGVFQAFPEPLSYVSVGHRNKQ